MAKKYLVVGNWKMNPASPDEAKKIAQSLRRVVSGLSHTDVVICPPALYVPILLPKSSKTKTSDIRVGVQGVSIFESGSHTGEISAKLAKESGVEYAIVGHSEQRKVGDNDAIVFTKLLNILNAGLTPIVCIGEEVRDENGAYLGFLKDQIKAIFNGLSSDFISKVIIAYEPVWAVGADKPTSSEQIYEMSIFVRKVFADMFGSETAMKMKVLYGGSVNASNAEGIMSVGKVDGLLVGRESLNVPGFSEVLKAVDMNASSK